MKTLKKYIRKGGYNYSNIVDNWTKMMNKKISGACYPISIKMGRELKNGNLILGVIHGKEIEIEYEKNNIVDKINSFFGYDCVKKVTLKVIQNKISNQKKEYYKVKDFSKIKSKIEKVKTQSKVTERNLPIIRFNFITIFLIANKICFMLRLIFLSFSKNNFVTSIFFPVSL